MALWSHQNLIVLAEAVKAGGDGRGWDQRGWDERGWLLELKAPGEISADKENNQRAAENSPIAGERKQPPREEPGQQPWEQG